MQLFYSKEIHDDLIFLNEEESWHCIKVLRHKSGDVVHVLDGRGGFYTTEIADAHPKHCSLKITAMQQAFKKRSYFLHIAIAPTKNADRIEWFAEKATETGVDEISFILCKTSERKVLKTERIEKVVESAIKQSIQAYMPVINELCSFQSFLKKAADFKGKKLIAHCRESENILLHEKIKEADKVLCLIGPEGDFTQDELNLALEHGFEPVSLGINRLRTETAGVYVCIGMSCVVGVNS